VIDQLREISDYCRLEIPAAHRRKIGVIGAGGIVAAAHLPAYDLAGLPVHGITDLNLDKARELAEKHKIGRVYESYEQLLADPEIEVVDIAVPASEQPKILLAALAAGKHVLAQKPLATSVEAAEELLTAANAGGLVVGVNQQLRFETVQDLVGFLVRTAMFDHPYASVRIKRVNPSVGSSSCTPSTTNVFERTVTCVPCCTGATRLERPV
jgi:hypothetical protein